MCSVPLNGIEELIYQYSYYMYLLGLLLGSSLSVCTN